MLMLRGKEAFCRVSALGENALVRPCVFVPAAANPRAKLSDDEITLLKVEGENLTAMGMMLSHFAVAEINDENKGWILELIEMRKKHPCLEFYPLILFSNVKNGAKNPLVRWAMKDIIADGQDQLSLTEGNEKRLAEVCDQTIKDDLMLGKRKMQSDLGRELRARLAGGDFMAEVVPEPGEVPTCIVKFGTVSH